MVRMRKGFPAGLQRIFRRKSNLLAERYPNYDIGRGSYGDLRVLEWGEGATLTVGAFVSVAERVTVFLGGDHRADWVTTYPFNILWPAAKHFTGHPKTRGNVHIGNDVWIGAGATIMSGVTLGDGAVVGAHAVVSRDVPPYGIVVGNPARLVKRRFDDQTVERLLEVKWWDWSSEVIERAMPDLLSTNLDEFLKRAEAGTYGNNVAGGR